MSTSTVSASPTLDGLAKALRNFAESARTGIPLGSTEATAEPDPRAAAAYDHAVWCVEAHIARLREQASDRLNGPDLRAQLTVVAGDRDRFRTERDQAIGVIGAMYCAAMGIDPEKTPPTDENVPDDPIGAVVAERANLRAAVDSACTTVAEMYAAATGRKGEGPRAGVVEDVAAVRERAEADRNLLALVAATLDELPRLPAGERKAKRETLRDLCRDAIAAGARGRVDLDEAADLLYEAWAIIANAGTHPGAWETLPADWNAAAVRWRDRWHLFNSAHCDAKTAAGLVGPAGGDHEQPVNTAESGDDAARRFAGELYRLESGMADLGLPVDGPVGTAAVDTALRLLADAARALGLPATPPAAVDPETLAVLPELAEYADDPDGQPSDGLIRDMTKIAQQYRGVGYDPQDRPTEILAVRRAAIRVGLVPFPDPSVPPRGYRGGTPPQPKVDPRNLVPTTRLNGVDHVDIVARPGDTISIRVEK